MKEYELQYHRDLLWTHLVELYVILSTSKEPDLNSILRSHKKLINKTYINTKNRLRTYKLLENFINLYKKDKSMSLQIFMNTLNNKNLLKNIEK